MLTIPTDPCYYVIGTDDRRLIIYLLEIEERHVPREHIKMIFDFNFDCETEVLYGPAEFVDCIEFMNDLTD